MSEEPQDLTVRNLIASVVVSSETIFGQVKSNGVVLAGGDIVTDASVRAGMLVVAPTIKTNVLRRTLDLKLLKEDTVLTAELITKNKLLIPPYTGTIVLSLDTASNYNEQLKLWESDIMIGGEMFEMHITNSALNNGNVYIKHALDGSINMTHLNKIVIKPGKTKVFYLRCDEYNNGYTLF
jgi:hypothetical protein